LSRPKLRIFLIAILIVSVPRGVYAGPEEQRHEADRILDDLGQRAFRWFQDNRNPKTGLMRDRSPNWKGRGAASDMASIASCGYYLSALPEAVRLGQITKADAQQNAVQVLRFAKEQMQHENGLFFHFIDWNTGQRWDKSEVSLLDSTIFFNGAMVAAEAFGPKVADVTNFLLDRVNWNAFVVQHSQSRKKLLSLGWSPESGLLGPADVHTSEFAMPYFLAIGSRTNLIDVGYWYNTSVSYRQVNGYTVLSGDLPLFTSYYGLGWHDLKGKVDRVGVNVDLNARRAALANRAFCRAVAKDYASYRKEAGSWWGISAGDAQTGYVAPGPVPGDQIGTVWATAALAAVPWIPREIKDDLVRWQASAIWQHVLGDYGLSPFNLDKNWVGSDVIGIDVGSFYVNLANHRNRTVWDLWMQHPIAVRAMNRLGFKTVPAESHGR
jgi:hypothetical protein